VETAREIARFVHRAWHLQARKGLYVLPESALVAECWMPLWPPPDWALTAAQDGQPGTVWCPKIDPGLWDRARDEALAAQTTAQAATKPDQKP
jgi:hypothetical protein